MPAKHELRFPGSQGASLAGVLHRPEGTVSAGVVLAHCFSCGKDIVTMTRLARGLVQAGYAVLRFDFTGLGDSEGEFGTTNLASGVGDVTAAVHALQEHAPGPCALVGHSLGGAAALLAAPALDVVRTVVTIGTPSSPRHLERVRAGVQDLPDGARAEVSIAGRPFTVERRFLDDLELHDHDGAVASLGRPLLILHAVDDEVVSIREGERLFAAASQPKAFYPLLGTDHLLRDRTGSQRALEVIRGWLDGVLSP